MSAMGDKKVDKPRKGRRYVEKSKQVLSWRDVEDRYLGEAIVAVTSTGAAIRFGYSRDMGAFAIGIVGDGDPYTIWAGSVDELYIKLDNLIKSFQED